LVKSEDVLLIIETIYGTARTVDMCVRYTCSENCYC